MRTHGIVVLLLAVIVGLSAPACGEDSDDGEAPSEATAAAGPPPEWPAPEDPLVRTRAAGLEPERRELLQTHRHAHLDVFFNGKPVTVPAGVGIAIDDPGVKHFDDPGGAAYGGIEECADPCISPLHTHDETGVLHTESAEDDLTTLGQFFTEWGVRLDDTCVGDYCTPATDIAVYVNGKPFNGNAAEIELHDHVEIAVVIGSPPDEIPDSADFSQA